MAWLAASRLRGGRFGVGIGLHPGGRSSSSSPSPPGRAGVASRGVSIAGGRVSALPRGVMSLANGQDRSSAPVCEEIPGPVLLQATSSHAATGAVDGRRRHHHRSRGALGPALPAAPRYSPRTASRVPEGSTAKSRAEGGCSQPLNDWLAGASPSLVKFIQGVGCSSALDWAGMFVSERDLRSVLASHLDPGDLDEAARCWKTASMASHLMLRSSSLRVRGSPGDTEAVASDPGLPSSNPPASAPADTRPLAVLGGFLSGDQAETSSTARWAKRAAGSEDQRSAAKRIKRFHQEEQLLAIYELVGRKGLCWHECAPSEEDERRQFILKPTGRVSCGRLAQVLKAWSSWQAWAHAAKCDLASPSALQLGKYLRECATQGPTVAPARYSGMLFLRRVLGVPFPLDFEAIRDFRNPPPGHAARQAEVLTPGEYWNIVSLAQNGKGPRKLLARLAHFMAISCIRVRHLA